MQQPLYELPLESSFDGAGLYALYYLGDFPPYQPISSPACLVPIYVGKADAPGARKGLVDLSTRVGPALYGRIADHSASIKAATNLRIEDFRVRHLVVEDIFIGMGEQLLIQQFRPLWNQHVSGFGLHNPGSRRYGGDRSEWDELHPGRPWHRHMRPIVTAASIKEKIKSAFKSGATATVDQMAAAAPPSAPVATPVSRQPEEQP